MIIKREGMFETNSSSTHSVVINGPKDLEKSFMDTLRPNYGKTKFVTSGGSYGWGYELLCGPEEKLAYLATAAFAEGLGASRAAAEFNLRHAVREHTGLDLVWVPDETDNGWYNQSIDHNSIGNIPLDDVKEIINILFNPNVAIEISHDNGGRRITQDDPQYKYYFPDENRDYWEAKYYEPD